MQIFLLSFELLESDIDGRIRCFFSPPFEWCKSRDMPCSKRFLCQHQREGEITTISPVRRRISDVTHRGTTKAKV